MSFDACCGPHLTSQNAPDAESLMRSRYSAFVLGDVPYLGALFRSTARTTNRTELLVFLTPRVVTDTAMAR